MYPYTYLLAFLHHDDEMAATILGWMDVNACEILLKILDKLHKTNHHTKVEKDME